MYFSLLFFCGKFGIKCRQIFISVVWSGQVINQAVGVEEVRLITGSTEVHRTRKYNSYLVLCSGCSSIAP
jgi:hypothetical protein